MLNSNATTNFRLNLPLNFSDDENLKFFSKINNYIYQDWQIKFLKNIRVSNNCVAFNYFDIIKESCANDEIYKNYCKSYKFFFKYCLPQFNFSSKKVILFANEYYSNYFHWHEMLQKIIILEQQNLLKDSLILLPKKYLKFSFIVESLKILGIKDQQILAINKKSNIKINELIFPILPNLNATIINKLRDKLTANVKNINNEFGDKIYISRQGQKLRFIENEQEVVGLLNKYGFKKVIMEKYSYQEQIAICHNARYVVGPHGAGLTNILFMKKNSALLELSAKDDEDFFNGFYILANMLEHNYLYQKCTIGQNSFIQDSHHSSLNVDLERLERNIKIMLNNNNV
jgi:hypothetical protein